MVDNPMEHISAVWEPGTNGHDPLRSPSIGELAGALAKAQASFDPLERTRTVSVRTQAGATYSFAYAPLDRVLDSTRFALTQNGLSITSQIRRESLRTILLHNSGEWIAAELELPKFAK